MNSTGQGVTHRHALMRHCCIYPLDTDHPNASLSDNKSPEKKKVADMVKHQRSFLFDGPGYSTDSDIDEYSDLEEDEGIRTDLPITQM